MKIAKAIMKYLEQNGVEYVFGISAGTVSAIYDAVNDVNIKPVITKNEAGAAYMAVKYASNSGKMGVCIAAGGVGANNMVNGVGDAMRSKVPVLFITGYVHRWQIGKGAIQELNTEQIFRPITKYSKTVLEQKNVLSTLREAIEIALTPPRGPVHVSIPIDIQVSELSEPMSGQAVMPMKIIYDDGAIEKAIEVINGEKDGIIMVGRGCRGLSEQVIALSEHLQWPIITTPEGKGIIPTDFYLNLGNYGFSGTDAATAYVETGPATCLLVLGSSLGESATRNYNPVLVNGKKVIHVDWDKRELGKVFAADVAVYHNLEKVIPRLMKGIRKKQQSFNKPMINEPYVKNHAGLSIRLFLERITEILPKNTQYISDIGEYMNFLFKYLPIPPESDFDISLNYGAMGSGVAGVIGAHLAEPKRPIAVFTGEGSFFMNGIEVLTAMEYEMPIIFFVINNAMLGYVEHGHMYLYGRTVEGFRQQRISISAMMNAVGIKSLEISSIEQAENIRKFIKNLKGPCVIELVTDGSEGAPVADRFKALEKTKKSEEEIVC